MLTGASGFVGRHALATLSDAGHEVHAVGLSRGPEAAGVTWHEADLLAASELLGDVEPEILIHLAWYAEHGKFWSSTENVRWVQASLGLLRAFAAHGGRRVVMAGSCAEYEWGGEGDLSERDSPLEPATLYGICKDALRRVAGAYAAETSVSLAWARLFFLYGPHEAPQRLVPAVIRPLLAGERAATTAGGQVRDFMHVQDAADALAALALSDVSGAVNVASGRAVSVADVIDLIGTLTGAAELIDRGARPSAASEPARIVADVARLREEVGFRPRISLQEGLESTIDWWRAQPGGPPPQSPARE